MRVTNYSKSLYSRGGEEVRYFGFIKAQKMVRNSQGQLEPSSIWRRVTKAGYTWPDGVYEHLVRVTGKSLEQLKAIYKVWPFPISAEPPTFIKEEDWIAELQELEKELSDQIEGAQARAKARGYVLPERLEKVHFEQTNQVYLIRCLASLVPYKHPFTPYPCFLVELEGPQNLICLVYHDAQSLENRWHWSAIYLFEEYKPIKKVEGC